MQRNANEQILHFYELVLRTYIYVHNLDGLFVTCHYAGFHDSDHAPTFSYGLLHEADLSLLLVSH